MKVLKEREYVQVKGKVLIPTETGMATNAVLMRVIADLNDADFTAQMESSLDTIAEGKEDWQRYLIDWNSSYFQPALNAAYRSLNLDPAKLTARAERSPAVLTEHSCPKCGSQLEEYAYQKDGQAKKMLRCSVAENRQGKCKQVAYFWTSRNQWWSPDLGELGQSPSTVKPKGQKPSATSAKPQAKPRSSSPVKTLPKKR